jgi:hypothetical protein
VTPPVEYMSRSRRPTDRPTDRPCMLPVVPAGRRRKAKVETQAGGLDRQTGARLGPGVDAVPPRRAGARGLVAAEVGWLRGCSRAGWLGRFLAGACWPAAGASVVRTGFIGGPAAALRSQPGSRVGK